MRVKGNSRCVPYGGNQ